MKVCIQGLTRSILLLAAAAIAACGGGTEPNATPPTPSIKANVPAPVMKAAAVTGGSAVAIHMYQALYGMAPSNATLSTHTVQATADPAAFARTLTNNFASTSSTALAKLVLDNLNVTAATVTAVNTQGQSEYAILLDALGQMFTFYGADARGQIILNATNLLAGLETDATYGVTAVSYNNQATANYSYSSNSANIGAAVVSTATANAGTSQSVAVGAVVTLDGSASTVDAGRTLTYLWTLTSKPAGSTAALSSLISAKPTFTADVAGAYVASLQVNDGKGTSGLATTSVNAGYERFQVAASGTIVDSLTGLTWMRCALGQVWTGSTCSGDAATYVLSEIPGLSSGFVYAGISNWRVPSVRELQSIVNLSRFNPSTDPAAFPNTPFMHFRTSSWEWTIGFGNSGTTQAMPSAFLPVRLVTSTTTLPVALMRLDRPSGDFADNLNGTVTHLVTGLMWQKCMKGQTFDSVANTCTGIAREYLPSQVANESLAGYNDWRVPTIEEWINFTDYTKRRPAINSELFQGTPTLTYFYYVMSSSIIASDQSQVWTFGIDYGDTQIGIPNFGRYVRMVRTIAR